MQVPYNVSHTMATLKTFQVMCKTRNILSMARVKHSIEPCPGDMDDGISKDTKHHDAYVDGLLESLVY